QLWVWIADRGQGIFHSLTKVHPIIKTEQAALKAAFEAIISGRAPEQRGNGLKFVRKTISDVPGGGISCLSGKTSVYYGEQGIKCKEVLERHVKEAKGTMTIMVWRLS